MTPSKLPDGTLLVTEKWFPVTFEAFNMIHTDSGGYPQSVWGVPPPWCENLKLVENTLYSLWVFHNETFEEFCIGEHDDMMMLAKQSVELTIAHRFLEAFYKDWP